MSKKHKHKSKPPKKQSFIVRLFRFFFPKDFRAEFNKGRMVGARMRDKKMRERGRKQRTGKWR